MIVQWDCLLKLGSPSPLRTYRENIGSSQQNISSVDLLALVPRRPQLVRTLLTCWEGRIWLLAVRYMKLQSILLYRNTDWDHITQVEHAILHTGSRWWLSWCGSANIWNILVARASMMYMDYRIKWGIFIHYPCCIQGIRMNCRENDI